MLSAVLYPTRNKPFVIADGMLDFIENGLDDPSSSSRARSQSSESSSSTSAYSSQSSTPPPGAIIETDVFDQAFASAHFSEGLNMVWGKSQ